MLCLTDNGLTDNVLLTIPQQGRSAGHIFFMSLISQDLGRTISVTQNLKRFYSLPTVYRGALTHWAATCLLSLPLIIIVMLGVMIPETAHAIDLEDILIENPKPLPPFKLTDHQLQAFTRDSLQGKWSFIFFGYTHCPDVCPVSLHEMDKIISTLSNKPAVADQFQFIFISVDPERDTPEFLASFVKYFNPKIIGATGDMDELKKLTAAVKVKFSKGEGSASEYTVNHSSAMLLIDPETRYYARFPAPHDVDRIYQWLREISRHTSMTLR